MASASLREVLAALDIIKYPNKDAVWEHFKELGKKCQRRLPNYRFVPRGGLSSPHVKFVTDADLIFSSSSEHTVSLRSFDIILQIATWACDGNVYSAKICKNEEELFDGDLADSGELRRLVAQEAPDVVAITGTCWLHDGWCIPVDFTLNCGESRMPKGRRIDRIIDNLEVCNFAKVISRIRALLSPASKKEFAAAWNKSGGALRFVVKQLDVVRRMPLEDQKRYISSVLALPGEMPASEWASIAEPEMQHRALNLLQTWKERLGDALGERKGEFLAALRAASDDSSPEGQSKSKGAGTGTTRPMAINAAVTGLSLAAVLPEGVMVSAQGDDGRWYSATVMRTRKKTPEVQVRFGGCDGEVWVGVDQVRSKLLKGGVAAPAKATADAAASEQAAPKAKSKTGENDLALLPIGTALQARFSDGVFYAAQVVRTRKGAKPIKVHYTGWDDTFDEWKGLEEVRSEALRKTNCG